MRLSVRWRSGNSAYVSLAALMAGSVLLSLALNWATALGRQSDNYAYDFLFRQIQPAPWTPGSIVLAIDEPTLAKYGGNTGIRSAVADGLEVGSLRVPSKLKDERDLRTIRIRYPPVAMGRLPRVSVAELDSDPSLASRFAGKAVFVGVTALAAGDSWTTPYSNGNTTPG